MAPASACAILPPFRPLPRGSLPLAFIFGGMALALPFFVLAMMTAPDQIPEDNRDQLIDGANRAQAQPVAPPLTADVVPVVQAVPVAAPAVGAAPLLEAIPVPEAAPAHVRPGGLPVAVPIAGSNRPWLLWGGSAAALLTLAVVIIILMQRPAPPGPGRGRHGAGAALKFREVKPMPMTLREGRKVPVIVTIERRDFSGPVTVSFENLPAGLQSAEITIKDKQERDQLYLMASFNSGIHKVDLRLVAVADNLRDVIVLPVTVVTNQNEPVSD